MYIRIIQLVNKGIKNCYHEDSIGMVIFFCFRNHYALRFAFTNMEHIHSGKPERGLDLSTLKVHTIEFLWPQRLSKIRYS
jgi:hypothetical protein